MRIDKGLEELPGNSHLYFFRSFIWLKLPNKAFLFELSVLLQFLLDGNVDPRLRRG